MSIKKLLYSTAVISSTAGQYENLKQDQTNTIRVDGSLVRKLINTFQVQYLDECNSPKNSFRSKPFLLLQIPLDLIVPVMTQLHRQCFMSLSIILSFSRKQPLLDRRFKGMTYFHTTFFFLSLGSLKPVQLSYINPSDECSQSPFFCSQNDDTNTF